MIGEAHTACGGGTGVAAQVHLPLQPASVHSVRAECTSARGIPESIPSQSLQSEKQLDQYFSICYDYLVYIRHRYFSHLIFPLHLGSIYRFFDLHAIMNGSMAIKM